MITKSQIKYIQSLNEKKLRQEIGVFVGEGPKIINELLHSGNIEPLEIFGVEEWWNHHLQNNNDYAGAKRIDVSQHELEKISFLTTPNQVLGIFKQPEFTTPLNVEKSITLLLDGIQDPGNLGTIIRTADWFDIKEIIASPDTTDVFNNKVVQSTMGSIARVRVTYQDLHSFISKYNNVPVYAATLAGKPVHEYGKISKGIILIGNESKGISEHLIKISTYKITIPKNGDAESLNAAVATGIILSHIV